MSMDITKIHQNNKYCMQRIIKKSSQSYQTGPKINRRRHDIGGSGQGLINTKKLIRRAIYWAHL